MANFHGWELIIILVLAVLVFGGFKKMPDAARGIGRSLRIFKAETKGLVDDGGAGAPPEPAPPVATQAAVQAAPAQPVAVAQETRA